jgi:hypothetical protein
MYYVVVLNISDGVERNMQLDYEKKNRVMSLMLDSYVTPAGFRSKHKAVPMRFYEEVKPFIDFTRYFVMFRGPRPDYGQGSTRKRDAGAFDVYERDGRAIREIRIEREAFIRGVEWSKSH